MGYLFTQLARFWETFIVSLGAHLAISIAGIFFFGFPVIVSLSAYTFAILSMRAIPFWIAVGAALIASVLAGLFFAALYRKLTNDSFAVFTLASILAFDALARSWESLTGGVFGISGISRPPFASTLFELMLLQGFVGICFFIYEYALLRSPYGRALQAHKENRPFVEASGRSSDALGSTAIGIAAIASGVMGILGVWRIQFLDPSFGGIPLFLLVLTVSILAMRPSTRWLMFATACVVFIPEALRFFPFPPNVLGHLRILLYSLFLIVLVRRLSAHYTFHKRTV